MLKKIAWFIDYYILYFMYNERKLDRYHTNMLKKYGDKYRERIDR